MVSFETIEHVRDDQLLLAEFSRILRPNGRLVISTPNLWPLERCPHHVREYDRASFEKALSGLFHVESMNNQNSGMAERAYNRGQPECIVATTSGNEATAECFLAVCHKRGI